jgi:hypothetical protein
METKYTVIRKDKENTGVYTFSRTVRFPTLSRHALLLQQAHIWCLRIFMSCSGHTYYMDCFESIWYHDETQPNATLSLPPDGMSPDRARAKFLSFPSIYLD